MKKIRLCSIFLSIFMLLLGSIGASAQSTEYHWYCVHAKNHERPQIGSELRFIEEMDGYYIDRRNSDTGEKVIYLTFDAGYENGNVAKILDVLKEEKVPGAFFILGNLIRRNPELVKRMAEEGHTVCNHTVRHKNMSCFDDASFLKELGELEEMYRECTGKEMAKFYRPPEGTFSKANLACAKANGYKTIFWSFGYPDWDNQRQMPTEKAKNIILNNLHSGEIMLLHPTSATNAAVLGEVIKEAKQQGYRFGTLAELTCG